MLKIIYSIRRRGIYSFRVAGWGRRLLEGGVYSYNVAEQFVVQLVCVFFSTTISLLSSSYLSSKSAKVSLSSLSCISAVVCRTISSFASAGTQRLLECGIY